MNLTVLATGPTAGFALLDSGHGRKWERWGPYRFVRPEPQALWAPARPDWPAHGIFLPGPDEDGGGRWQLDPALPTRWPVEQAGLRIWAMPTPFRHLGFFPDMAPHWERLADVLRPGERVLNLFAYSGLATLVALRAGAEVVHVDASPKAVAAARANAQLAGLADRPVRWIVDDARAFVARERRRGRRYHAILLDPPKHGRGPKGEAWELARDLPPLVADCVTLLDPAARLMILTTYAVRLSALALQACLAQALAGRGGRVQAGEMGLVEEARGVFLPTAIFARWEGTS
ncbi:MAG: RsmD family RNA methyltransferase [Sphingomonadaceae bacterium]|uniref:class I SAM-dependent methyltransferase n=1 Tax=Thermaurantiacus sp. TaxID=2820283 RepID=UPI00298F2D22|nr:RsmD family RNA methyltransferase [Thermaurantiacus sp.]MCS6987834.1 RsmD family RNA methyltransferase [Sphingomonadaceae bacterium]MDW8414946.1 RsmD family RNA methyltransferase [Thermaurantiacus sp.]